MLIGILNVFGICFISCSFLVRTSKKKYPDCLINFSASTQEIEPDDISLFWQARGNEIMNSKEALIINKGK